MSLKIAFKLSLIMIPFQVINSVVCVNACVWFCECVSGSVFTSRECRMAGLIISTIKAKYIQLHPGQVLMKDSRQAGLFHLSSVVGQYPHLRIAALVLLLLRLRGESLHTSHGDFCRSSVEWKVNLPIVLPLR